MILGISKYADAIFTNQNTGSKLCMNEQCNGSMKTAILIKPVKVARVKR